MSNIVTTFFCSFRCRQIWILLRYRSAKASCPLASLPSRETCPPGLYHALRSASERPCDAKLLQTQLWAETLDEADAFLLRLRREEAAAVQHESAQEAEAFARFDRYVRAAVDPRRRGEMVG